MLARLRGQSKATTEGHEISSKRRSKKRSLKLSSYERSVVPHIIQRFGYIADNQSVWRTSENQPVLQIRITSHSESKGHTYYHYECDISMTTEPSSLYSWSGKRRLQHLRRGLHDACKKELGSGYHKLFKDTPFAHRGGVRGTTKRLNAWCARLSECANERLVPPVILAQVCKLLEAPKGKSQGTRPTSDSCSSLSTTDAEENDEVVSDCSSYESDFESESCSDISECETIAEDLQFEEDGSEEDDTPIAQFEPNSICQC